MHRAFILVSLLFVALAGCTSSVKLSTKQMDADQNGIAEQTVTNTDNLSQRSYRSVTKRQAVETLCKYQSGKHNEQRMIFSLPAAMLKGVDNKTASNFVVYNPAVSPFDMTGCITEGMRSGWERIGYALLDFGKTLVKYGTGYAIADKAINKIGTTVKLNGPGNKVGLSDDGNVDIREGQAGDGSTYFPEEDEEPESTEEPVEEPDTDSEPVERRGG